MNELDSKQNTSLGTGAKHYMPGLDGLRALSVLAVIAYHLNFHWAQGGFLGVGIFFTLSGYLITDQLMLQWQRSGKIDLKDFWIRRARRLMPAMFFMLAVVCLWLNFFDRSRLDALKGDFASVALYVNNWWLIFHNVSYFESFGPPSPIGHLWSLAIEEQFYILWPLILMLGFRFAHRRSKLVLFTLFGAAASIFAMALIYQPGADPSRVYYGTDTRAFALLIGAAFAIAFPSRNLPRLISAKTRLALDLIGGAGLLGIILMIWRTNEYDSSLYIGGLALFTVLSAIVVVILAHPASHVARFIGCKPLRWVGIRSYSLYLWHYPVMTLTTPAVDVGGFNAGRTIMQLIMSFLLAALSWKFIEDPIRRGSVSRLWGNMHVLKAPFRRRFLLVLVMTPLFLFVNSCSSRMDVENKLSAASPESTEQVQAVVPQTTDEKPFSQIADSTKPALDIPKQQPEEQSPAGKPSAAEVETVKEITAIGDSVILDAAPYLKKLLPGIIIDGKVGRQMSQANKVIDQLKSEGKLGSHVIIELGTNGPFSTKQLSQLLTSIGEHRHIILVNVRVPKNWQDTVNSDLERVASQFSNAVIVDWFSASKGKESYFYNDGVHLKQEGAKQYASLVSEAIRKQEP